MSTTHCFLILGVVALVAIPARAEDAVRLEERFVAGYQYRVSTRVDLRGALTPPAEKGQGAPKALAIEGDSAIDYDERVLDMSGDGQVRKTARLVRRMHFRRTVGEQAQETSLRKSVSRLVLLRRGSAEVPFSPDGPLTWGEIDLVRTDVFTPALAGMLPTAAVRPGEAWTATTAAVQELTDLERIEDGKLECRLEHVTTLEQRRHARISFRGTIRGAGEDGPCRQELDGYFFFDLQSNHLSYLYINGRHALLDAQGQEVGYVKGRFVLTRQILGRISELSDDALRGISLEPNADNTLLLYDNPDLGVRFLYARRWKVAVVRGSQLALDAEGGHGILITLDAPARVPTGAQFLSESREWLVKQNARLLRTEPPRKLQATPPVEQFALEAEMGGQRFLMDYYVTRQATGGATLAARLLPADRANLRKEVENIARSLVITRALEDRR
jgi:hypothetical protein